MEIVIGSPVANKPSERSPRLKKFIKSSYTLNSLYNLDSNSHSPSTTSPVLTPIPTPAVYSSQISQSKIPSRRLQNLSECKRKKEKVVLQRPKQLVNIPTCVYKEQCRQARIQFEVVKQKKALQALLQSDENGTNLRNAEEIEREKNKLNELRYLQIKNFSILFTRSSLKEGKKLAVRRYKQKAMENFLLVQRQILAVQRIIRFWKFWRRYKYSVAFQVLFDLFELHVRTKKTSEEKIFQHRLQARKEMENQYQLKVKKLREDYHKNMQQLHRNKVIPVIQETQTHTNQKLDLHPRQYPSICANELYHWCDPQNETFNSFFNMQRYREWKEKFRVPDPLSCIVNK